jgi:hypothetical protein
MENSMTKTTSEDEVVVADFGGGCTIVGKRLEGETDKDVKMRYAREKRRIFEERDRRAAEQRRYFDALWRWQPPKGTEFRP